MLNLIRRRSPTPNFIKIRQETRKLQVNINLHPYAKYGCKRADFRGTYVCFTNRGETTAKSANQPNALAAHTRSRSGGRTDGRTDVVHIRRSNSLQVNIPVLLSWSHKTHATLCRQNVSFTRAELCCACSSH